MDAGTESWTKVERFKMRARRVLGDYLPNEPVRTDPEKLISLVLELSGPMLYDWQNVFCVRSLSGFLFFLPHCWLRRQAKPTLRLSPSPNLFRYAASLQTDAPQPQPQFLSRIRIRSMPTATIVAPRTTGCTRGCVKWTRSVPTSISLFLRSLLLMCCWSSNSATICPGNRIPRAIRQPQTTVRPAVWKSSLQLAWKSGFFRQATWCINQRRRMALETSRGK